MKIQEEDALKGRNVLIGPFGFFKTLVKNTPDIQCLAHFTFTLPYTTQPHTLPQAYRNISRQAAQDGENYCEYSCCRFRAYRSCPVPAPFTFTPAFSPFAPSINHCNQRRESKTHPNADPCFPFLFFLLETLTTRSVYLIFVIPVPFSMPTNHY